LAHVSTYLNLPGTSEEAFNFYAAAFGTEILGIMRHGDVPGAEGLTEEQARGVINIALPILGGHILMATDTIPGIDDTPLVNGNNVSITLHPDSREEADRLFAALSEGGQVHEAMADMFWGDYWGFFTDKFGIQWMINYSEQTYG
jgi:PhnB protein